MHEKNSMLLGCISLGMTALIGSAMGMFARELASELDVFEQVLLRTFWGALAVFVLCFRKVSLSRIATAPRADLILVVGRAIAFYVLAISLGTMAFIHGSYGPVAMMLALPMIALVSHFLFGERMSGLEALLVAVAFSGAVLTLYGNGIAGFSIEWPLLVAALAAFLTSFGVLGQKKQSSHLNNFEVTFLMLAAATVVLAGVVLVQSTLKGSVPTLSAHSLAIGAVAGLANAGFLLTSNFGMSRVKGAIANNIMAMQPVFAVGIGYLVYRETMTSTELLGGALIVAAAVLIARVGWWQRSKAAGSAPVRPRV